MKRLGKNIAIVSSKELGTNCWLPKRFLKGERCDWVWLCKYPERKTCQAVPAEIAHLNQEKERLAAVSINLDKRLEKLAAMLEN